MFEDATFDSAGRIKTKNKTTVMISFILETVVLVILAVIPLIFTEALPARGFLTSLVAPPPPPPPPPPAAAPKVRVIPKAPAPTQQMVQPRSIPKQVAIIEEAPSAVVGGVVGGVIGGMAGGSAGGVIGGIISVAPPPPPPPKEEVYVAPIRVGGQVQAAKMVRQVPPPYPPLARQARIQGTVRLEAIIDKDGNVKSLSVVSGHPLLVQSALDAVAQWKYQPTLLNGVPVEVATTIDVNFVMR